MATQSCDEQAAYDSICSLKVLIGLGTIYYLASYGGSVWFGSILASYVPGKPLTEAFRKCRATDSCDYLAKRTRILDRAMGISSFVFGLI